MKRKFILLALSLSLFACGPKSTLHNTTEGWDKDYSEVYHPYRFAIEIGDREGLAEIIAPYEVDEQGSKLSRDDKVEKMAKEEDVLFLVERGLIALNIGDYDTALIYLDAAEKKLESDNKLGGNVALNLIGQESMGNYWLRDYERVMVLNYKALIYALRGDERAYPITRAAIDLQQKQWETFETEMHVTQKAIDDAGKTKEDFVGSSLERDLLFKAARVPNAYVNPFGDFLDALINEIKAFEKDESDLRGNACIAYNKVLKNNAECTAAQNAINAIDNRTPKGKLICVLLADGFSPERVTAQSSGLTYASLQPVSSEVVSAKVTVAGKNHKMSPLSLMESLILRDEQDRHDIRNRHAILETSIVGFAANLAAAFVGQSATKPETRSWRTLPREIMVTHIYVPENIREVTLSTYDKNGRRVASSNIKVENVNATVVYGVSYGKHLFAKANSVSFAK